jgi:cell division protein FtsB
VRKARIELDTKRIQLEERHRSLESQVRLIEHPDNLETELRTRFNYKKPGEQVIVVVPPEDRPQ